MYSFIVINYVNLILWEEKEVLGRISFLFLGHWGEAGLILRIWVAKANYFQGAWDSPPGILGDQCIIFREHRPPPGGLCYT